MNDQSRPRHGDGRRGAHRPDWPSRWLLSAPTSPFRPVRRDSDARTLTIAERAAVVPGDPAAAPRARSASWPTPTASTRRRPRTEFGIRTVTADARNGLRINGAPVKLRGAAIHHDNGVIGAHTLDAADDRRIRILKESGFNAIRSAHNPASRALLRACDRHGVLVMDELTDAWFRPKVGHDYSRDFEEWWERDLEALVANDFNHPSVIMYSIGNEIAETATPRGIATNRRSRAGPASSTRPGWSPTASTGSSTSSRRRTTRSSRRRRKRHARAGENPNKNLIGVLNLIIGILDRMLDRIVRLQAVDKRTRDAFADLDVAGYNYMVGRYELDAKAAPGPGHRRQRNPGRAHRPRSGRRSSTSRTSSATSRGPAGTTSARPASPPSSTAPPSGRSTTPTRRCSPASRSSTSPDSGRPSPTSTRSPGTSPPGRTSPSNRSTTRVRRS